MTEKRIIATFRPQTWQRDYAIDVDPEGPLTWDVTDEVLALSVDERCALRDNRYDELRCSKNAPAWVSEWSGPFYIEVQDSISDYFNDTV